MPSEYNELKILTDELIGMIASLSNSQRQLTLNALDYQALGFAKRHEKENAIDVVDDLGKILATLVKLLKKQVGQLANRVDYDRL